MSTYEVEQNPQHPVQGRNPRTGIGLIDDNHFVFVVVDGCTTAYNLDGGGSSTMYFKGEVVNSPVNKGGQRDISDILFAG